MTGFFRFLLVSLTFILGTTNLAHAASFDCNKATTETEIAICNDPELSALDELASALSYFVGLRIDLERIPDQREYISDEPMTERMGAHYSSGIEKMMGLLSRKNLPNLIKSINALTNWRGDLFSDNKVFIIRSKNEELELQNGIIVFNQTIDGLDDKPVFYNLDTHINALSTEYEFHDGIIIHEVYNRRFYSQTKYRYQDACWREIGSEWKEFFDSGPVNEAMKVSTNLLTGRSIKTLYSGKGVVENFSPSVICLTRKVLR